MTTASSAPSQAGADAWQPKRAPLMTRWSADVRPDDVHREYPRPQMVRKDWQNLNGLWEFAVTPKDASAPPAKFDGQILVPFPIESALSGVMRRVDETQRLWYRREFEVSADWKGRRILLHFGAVDWDATVTVNGKEVGRHTGGYDPFTFDITDALTGSGKQQLVVSVWDPTDTGTQPRGKQIGKSHGIWYTPTTGIWQTVWLEPVPKTYIERIRIVPDVDAGAARVTAFAGGDEANAAQARVVALHGGKEIASATGPAGKPVELKIPNAKLWSPDSPHLYDLKISLHSGGRDLDTVDSYFGLRKISIGRDERGITRILFNGKFVFQYGPLDQGFWPDGLYTAPTDEALRFDVEQMKRYGFNMVRKHVKVEPARWYYWCDRLGLIVWQDMPSGDAGAKNGDQITRSEASAEQFERELEEMIRDFHNHPSICVWVPFNEGWGQYDTPRIAKWVKELDPTRLVDSASGWTDVGVGDMYDDHVYPGPAARDPEPTRASVLGEFGGLGLPLEDHTWQDKNNWGYRRYETKEKLAEAYEGLVRSLAPLIRDPGLSCAVYTQLTDVEIEVNGYLTYDREVHKMDPEKLAKKHRELIQSSTRQEPPR